MSKQRRSYNALGLTRFTAAAAELVPMIVNGSGSELQQAIKNLYDTARREFPHGPREVGDSLNQLCAELDLPSVFTARNKDTNEILDLKRR